MKCPAVLLSLSLALLVSAASAQEGSQDWWKTAVFYQIYPRSFKDSDNDGIGDLRGIISRLDHLVDAGVTALWLSPIYRSPQVDHGYDISDFRDVDPIFGTLDDAKELFRLAKEKGLKIILDFVPNHSSNLHEWFEKSENREPGYENYYVWLDGKEGNTRPPNNWISYFHGPAWEFSQIRQQWYLHQFSVGQPDLNYRDPALVQEMKDVLTYWLDLGVDGFRVDIVSALFEEASFPDEPLSGNPGATEDDHGYLNHIYTNDQPETYDMVYQWRALLDEYTAAHGGDARVMMTESYSGEEQLFPYYGNETHDGAHFTFNFWFITRVNGASTAWDVKNTVDHWFSEMPTRYTANWVLGNHDQHRVATRYGQGRADGMNMLSLSLPGVAVTYNGEEIAMENGEVSWEQGQDPQACNGRPEDFHWQSRDFERTPFHWDASVNAGFNEGGPTWLPVSSKYLECNLADQSLPGSKSHYNVYKEMVALRRTDTYKYGRHATVVFNDNVFSLVRHLEANPTYVLVINIRGGNETVDLSTLGDLPDTLTVAVASTESSRNKGDVITTNSLDLTPNEALVLTF